MQRAQATWLPDGRRLHLHHGPIDMIVGIEGPGRSDGFERAVSRFDTLLEELVEELDLLRTPLNRLPRGETAQRMVRAVTPFAPSFVTPMAAVAGAGADTVLAAICKGNGIHKAYVNNGGDVAFHLTPGLEMCAAIVAEPLGNVVVQHSDPVRGIASSGWRGRSHSLGVADTVAVLARTAAMADAAATMIANAVDLPGHPAITRIPARELAPDSDLGDRPVTTHVGALQATEITAALAAGAAFAQQTLDRGLIAGAAVTLQGATRLVGTIPLLPQNETEHA